MKVVGPGGMKKTSKPDEGEVEKILTFSGSAVLSKMSSLG